MVELLLYSSLTCKQVDALMLRVVKHEDLDPMIKIELIETIEESSPHCRDAND